MNVKVLCKLESYLLPLTSTSELTQFFSPPQHATASSLLPPKSRRLIPAVLSTSAAWREGFLYFFAKEGKGEKERYTHLNAEFRRIARRDKKAFLSNQYKEIEENNRMGKTRDISNKIRDIKGTFYAKMGTIKDRNGMALLSCICLFATVEFSRPEYWSR